MAQTSERAAIAAEAAARLPWSIVNPRCRTVSIHPTTEPQFGHRRLIRFRPQRLSSYDLEEATMGGKRDHYEDGRRDARYDKGYSPPHEGGLESVIKSDDEVRDKDDYRTGYRDEKSGR